MREPIKYVLLTASLGLLLWSLYKIGYVLPLEANVAAYQILYLHVPSFFAAFTGFFLGLFASGIYLATGNFKYDSFAAGANEVALMFATAGLASGMIWARYAWGIWWTWDARLSSMLLCWLVYVGYLFLRKSVEEPTQRARLSAVLSIFGCVNVAFVYKSIEWYRTQHPSPVLSFRNGGDHMGPGLEAPIWWNWLALVCLGVVIAMVRMQQGEMSREIDALRRQAHSY
ncbi:MAG TPA: cytochrome c biogenesis protein CcsA [Bryobacteraceae bacterium]|jgi:heme exporter protein C